MKKKFLMFIFILMCFVGTRVFAQGTGKPDDPVILTGLDYFTVSVNDMTAIDMSGDDVFYGYIGEFTITDAKYTEFSMYLPPKDASDNYTISMMTITKFNDSNAIIQADEVELSNEEEWNDFWVYLEPGRYTVMFGFIMKESQIFNYETDFFTYFEDVYKSEMEPNNELEESTYLQLNTMHEASIGILDDKDYYTTVLTAGQKARIYFTNEDVPMLFKLIVGDLTAVEWDFNITSDDMRYDPARCQYYYEFIPANTGAYYFRLNGDQRHAFDYEIGIYQSGTTNPYILDRIDYIVETRYEDLIPVFRMYNPGNGEHLYTTDAYEAKVIYVEQGWGFEGIGWQSSTEGVQVYRLYQPQLGNHLYTSDLHEIDVITKTQGWLLDFDGAPVMYSSEDESFFPVYRLYNQPLNGMHHLTTDENEYNVLPSQGWAQEGISMYASGVGLPSPTNYYHVNF